MNMPVVTSESKSVSSSNLILHPEHFDRVMRMAEIMAGGSATVPKHLQKNVGDCAAIVMQSMQWGMNPFAVAQKTHIVEGVMGYEAQLINAVITSLAPTKDRLNFEWFGDWSPIIGKFKDVESKTKKDADGNFKKYRVPDWTIQAEKGLGVRVWATLKGEETPRYLELLMTQARTRNSPLWVDDPKQQLAYLGIKRWSRLYCPDVIMGVYSRDELEDSREEIDITPRQQEHSATPTESGNYSEADFKKNFPAWEKAIASGKNTAEKIILIVGSKAPLTEEQCDLIRSIAPPIEGELA